MEGMDRRSALALGAAAMPVFALPAQAAGAEPPSYAAARRRVPPARLRGPRGLRPRGGRGPRRPPPHQRRRGALPQPDRLRHPGPAARRARRGGPGGLAGRCSTPASRATRRTSRRSRSAARASWSTRSAPWRSASAASTRRRSRSRRRRRWPARNAPPRPSRSTGRRCCATCRSPSTTTAPTTATCWPRPRSSAASPASAVPRADGRVTPGTLFRGSALYFDPADPNGRGRHVTPPGVLDGPIVSQFLLRDVPYGAQWIRARIRTATPDSEFLTDYEEWLRTQNGETPSRRAAVRPDAALHRDRPRPRRPTSTRTRRCAWAASLLLATPAGGPDPRYGGLFPLAQPALSPTQPLPPLADPERRRRHLRAGLRAGAARRGDTRAPSARPTGRSGSCTARCGRRPTAGWRTSAWPTA